MVLVLSLPMMAQQVDAKSWGKNTPGVELMVHEGPRQHTPSGTVLVYSFAGKGFTPGVAYNLWGWIPGEQPKKFLDGVSFDDRGVLICSGKAGFCSGQAPDDPVNIRSEAVQGEPKRFGVIAPDGNVAAFAEDIPFPIEASDKNCKVSVIRVSPLGEVVLARATGFVPYEMLTVTTGTGTESPTATPEGTWEGLAGNGTSGGRSGVATLKVSGKDCAVAVSYDFGAGSAKIQ